MEKPKSIEQMFDIKQKNIKEGRSEVQLSIQLGQSVNLAQQEIMARKVSPTENPELFDKLVNFYMEYLNILLILLFRR